MDSERSTFGAGGILRRALGQNVPLEHVARGDVLAFSARANDGAGECGDIDG